MQSLPLTILVATKTCVWSLNWILVSVFEPRTHRSNQSENLFVLISCGMYQSIYLSIFQHSCTQHSSFNNCCQAKNIYNIAFARGGSHLPIAHALRLPKTDIILWGRDFFFVCGIFFGVGGFFWAGGQICLKFFKSFCFILGEIKIEKK